MMDLEKIQSALRQYGLDGWLFYDFHNRDLIAYRILGLDPHKMTTRRWYYFIPAEGEPRKLVHAIEQGKLDPLPGEKKVYLPWPQQHQLLKEILGPARKVAMQYSPLNAIPYVSMVDGGTVDLVRSLGVEIISSADLVQLFEAYLDEAAFETHLEAGRRIHLVLDETFREVSRRIHAREAMNEYEIQCFMADLFRANHLQCDGEYPIVAVNAHAADPHYAPDPEKASPIRKDDLLLIDLWAKLDQPGAIYFDITWMGYLGDPIPQKYTDVFQIVRAARDRAVEFAADRFAHGRPVHGWEVDNECRRVIETAGYGQYFIHRTGHSIGEAVHGNGVHIDNLETKDERQLMPGILFSVEPGIYFAGDFGVRTEIDVFITHDSKVRVTGPIQQELVKVLDY